MGALSTSRKRARPNPSESIWQASINKNDGWKVGRAGCKFFFCCPARVPRSYEIFCLDSMTVRKVESKIARSYDAWAQWQLRTPYCENASSSSWCIKCSGLMPSSSNCGPYGITVNNNKKARKEKQVSYSRKLNKLDLWRPHGSERSGIVWHAWKLDVAVDTLMAKEERTIQETG
jgi:hypothetical protein